MKKTYKSSNSLINVMRLCVFCSCVLAIFRVCFVIVCWLYFVCVLEGLTYYLNHQNYVMSRKPSDCFEISKKIYWPSEKKNTHTVLDHCGYSLGWFCASASWKMNTLTTCL